MKKPINKPKWAYVSVPGGEITMPEVFLREYPGLADIALRVFDGDWGRLAEEWRDNPTVTQAIKDEIARRLSGAGPATS